MTAMRYTLEQLNAAPREAFVAALAGIYEHSPWVAEEAARARPFASVNALIETMAVIVAHAGQARQLALVKAHPELAGKAAVRGELTAESRREQAGAGLMQCTQDEFDTLQRLNRAYRDKFGFPFILAVRGYERSEIIAIFQARLGHGRDEELRENLAQIDRIARFRIAELIEG